MKLIREKATGFYSVWNGESKYAIIGKPEDLAKRKIISPEEAIVYAGKWLAIIEPLDNAVIVFDTLRDAKIHYSKLKES